MQNANCKWKDANGNSRKAIPGLVASLIILIVTVLLTACKSGDTPPSTFPTSSNDDLAGLSFYGSLNQPFSADRYDYTGTVDYCFRSLQITPVTADENASVTVDGVTVRSGFASRPVLLSTGVNNPILIEVISEDRKYSRIYRLVVTVSTVTQWCNANLSDLTLSAGVLDSIFQPYIADYTASVSFTDTVVQVIATTEAVGASVSINNTTGVNSNQADNSATNAGAAYVFQ